MLKKLIQYFIALVLLATSIGKLLDIQGFAQVVESFQIFSGWITLPIALGMALTELALSLWLFSGKKLKYAAIAVAALHVIFIIWLAIALLRGLDIQNCGCFGVFLVRPLTYVTFIEDGVMVALSLALYFIVKKEERLESEKTRKLKKFYKFWSYTYDGVIKIWNNLIAKNAEGEVEKFLEETFTDEIDVLDVACGTGINIDRLNKQNLKINSYTGIDLSPDMQKKAKKKAKGMNAKFIIDDVFKYKPKEQFDLITCTWLLSHLDNPAELVNKYMNHLKENGYLLLIFQGEVTASKTFTNVFNKVESLFQATLVSEEEIDKFPSKPYLKKKYLHGYIRLLIYKKI